MLSGMDLTQIAAYLRSTSKLDRIMAHSWLFILIAGLFSTVSAELEVVSTNETSISFKNADFLDKKFIPDVQGVLQKQLNDKKFENLNMFLVILKNSLTEAGYQVAPEIPFTIIVPKVDTKNVDKERLKEFILEHLVPGIAFQAFNEDDLYGNANHHQLHFAKMEKNGQMLWSINNVKILRMEIINDKMSVIFIDGFLGDKKGTFSKRNIQETNRYNEPQRLEMKNTTKHDSLSPVKDANKLSVLMTFLNNMKSGTKVFQHFLTKSNVSQIVNGGSYTVLIPSDNAFQRWHPIDWGFYPFSVQEFTENILSNHFLVAKNPIRIEDIKKSTAEIKVPAMGGETVVFKNYPTPTANNVSIISEYTLPNGNQVFLISEVLFVSEAVVSRLHQQHKDKETPPLLAFPWFGAQFLSHSFLALERDSRFTQITRFLNTAEIAPHVSGSNYTFFVPMDSAFEKLGGNWEILPDDILASDAGVKLLLNHFIKGRLYERDLRNDEVFETIGGGAVKIEKILNNTKVNNANIVESQVFVYNLGTMYYIDEILYPNILLDAIASSTQSPSAVPSSSRIPFFGSTVADAELVPNEITDPGTIGDVLFDADDEEDDEIITPRAMAR